MSPVVRQRLLVGITSSSAHCATNLGFLRPEDESFVLSLHSSDRTLMVVLTFRAQAHKLSGKLRQLCSLLTVLCCCRHFRSA